MPVRDNVLVVDRQAAVKVREHWSTKLEATCQALARASRDQMSCARVSQQGCGVPEEARMVRELAEHLASEFGLTALLRPTGTRLSVIFGRPEAS